MTRALAIRAKRRAQFGLTYDAAQFFRHNKPGKKSAISVQKVSLRTGHHKLAL